MFRSHDEAQAWVKEKIREYGGRDRFLSSAEYRKAYPEIARLHAQARSTFVERERSFLEEAGLKPGDRVEHTSVSPFGFSETFSGTIVMRKGEPWVKIDQPAPKKSQRWSAAWRRAATPRARNVSELKQGLMPPQNYRVMVVQSYTDRRKHLRTRHVPHVESVSLPVAMKMLRRLKRQGHTAWIETDAGEFMAVPGAGRKPSEPS